MTAQLIDVTPAEYHSLPGFSASTAKTLLHRSPLHAWHEHPVFGGEKRDPTKLMDRGQIMGKLILGRGADLEVLDYADWRTNAAKADRDNARDAGKVPVLAEQHKQAYQAALAIMAELVRRGVRLDGTSEQAMVWQEKTPDGLLDCRGAMDHLTADNRVIYDLKIIDDASNASVERSAENLGHGIQRAAYVSGLSKVFPHLAGRIVMRFIFAEPEPPYAVNICEPDGVFCELGERRWERACAAWARCLKQKHWPAHGTGINQITAPAWALAREGYMPEER